MALPATPYTDRFRTHVATQIDKQIRRFGIFEVATMVGVQAPFISKVRHGDKSPSEKVLRYLAIVPGREDFKVQWQ